MHPCSITDDLMNGSLAGFCQTSWHAAVVNQLFDSAVLEPVASKTFWNSSAQGPGSETRGLRQ